MPFFSSIVISPHVLAPPAYFHASSRPRVVAELAGPRNGVERPDEPAGDHVVGADVAGRRSVAFAGVRSDDDQVFEDAAGGLVRPASRRGSPVRMSTNPSVPNVLICVPLVASIARRPPPVVRISRRSDRSLLLPVGQAALGRLLRRRPDRLAGRRIERDDDALRARDVHHAVDNERVERQPRRVAGHRIEPGALQLLTLVLLICASAEYCIESAEPP